MPPLTSRQIFVWSLPALFLLSFLWYKRKKGALRSDPGGTDSKPKRGVENSSVSNQCAILVDAIKGTNTTEDKNSVVFSSVVTAEIPEDKVIQELVSVAESSSEVEVTNISDCAILAGPSEEKSSKYIVTADAEVQDITLCIVDISDKSEIQNGISAELVSEEDQNTSVEITFDVKEIKEKEDIILGQQISAEEGDTSVEIIFDAKAVIDVEDSISTEHISDLENSTSIDTIYDTTEIILPINSASILNPDIQDLFVQNNSIVDSVICNQPQTLADFDTDKTALCSDLECVDKISKEGELITKVLVIPTAATIVSFDNTCDTRVSSSVEEQEAVLKVIQGEEEDSVEKYKEDCPVLNHSWAEECELETEAKVEDMAREVSSDVILEVSNTSNLEGTTIEDDGSVSSMQVEVASLESKLSSIEMEESVDHEHGAGDRAAVIKEGHSNERDSANHSPAEVMLGSPSLSSYSDSQSEGSSDSGKGCSDVVTPPSRTPASGSSVSGDLPVSSVYEFVLPQHLVGRLIGRHGQTVHHIKTKSHTNIIIKRHPDTTKVKICSIEGTPMDVESALELIRGKFPLKRYPTITLDQVSFTSPSSFPLMPDNFQLQLVEGVNNDAILSSLVSPAHFFLQQPTHPTYPSLNRLNMCMNFCYNEPTAPALPTPIAASVICVAPTMGGWYRAQVIASDPASDSSYIKFIDYGGYQTVENSLLRQIRSDFIALPFQAAECYLANVKPVGGVWACEAMTLVEELTQGQVIQAQIHGYAEDGVPVVYLFSIQGTQVLVVNRELVLRGYAEWDEPTEDPEPAAEIEA